MMGVLDSRNGFGDVVLVEMKELTPFRAKPIGHTRATQESFRGLL